MSDLTQKIKQERLDRVRHQAARYRRIEKEIRDHEAAHTRTIPDRVERIEFDYRVDENNIARMYRGQVHIDVDTTDIETLERISRAALAVHSPSQQDLLFKAMVDAKIRLTRQIRR